jgi:hypothetical protein
MHLAKGFLTSFPLGASLQYNAVPRVAIDGYDTHSDGHIHVREDVHHRASELPLEQCENA